MDGRYVSGRDMIHGSRRKASAWGGKLMKKKVKKILKAAVMAVVVILLLAAGLLAFLTVTEYRPEAVETPVRISEDDSAQLKTGEAFSMLTWNVGYAGLGAGEDFFMDGGKEVQPAEKSTVEGYLEGIEKVIDSEKQNGCSIVMLQETDRDSERSYHIDEVEELKDWNTEYAMNFSCAFIPYPVPPIGSVHGGIMTVSKYADESSSRIALPCPFSWPVRIANLKRCILAEYIPVSGTGKDLVIVNLHLEAYDDGSGKAAQTAMLKDFMETEYEKGNYVIAGGDFNSQFPGATDIYPDTHADLWSPAALDESMIPDGFSFEYDLSNPSCRLNNQVYDPSDTKGTQYYVIDGFIVSPNVDVSDVQVLDEGFAYADHNPVRMDLELE